MQNSSMKLQILRAKKLSIHLKKNKKQKTAAGGSVSVCTDVDGSGEDELHSAEESEKGGGEGDTVAQVQKEGPNEETQNLEKRNKDHIKDIETKYSDLVMRMEGKEIPAQITWAVGFMIPLLEKGEKYENENRMYKFPMKEPNTLDACKKKPETLEVRIKKREIKTKKDHPTWRVYFPFDIYVENKRGETKKTYLSEIGPSSIFELIVKEYTPQPEEKRRAQDGELYTKAQFIGYYGVEFGTAEWEQAK